MFLNYHPLSLFLNMPIASTHPYYSLDILNFKKKIFSGILRRRSCELSLSNIKNQKHNKIQK